ncbi:MAG: Clp protease ClpP [Alphaproteobacteria bacterium]|nr:Clp protease ClpP [Alphaproteobacteria bacterium]
MSDQIEAPSNVVPFRTQGAKLANALVVKNDANEISINGEVGWDVRASDIIKAMKAMDGEGKTITIDTLDSPGGDVFEGYAIGNALASMKATVVVRVGALAGSIASYIAVCANKVVMPKNSFMMIHEAWAFSMGSAAEIRKTAELLDKMNNQLAAAYTAKRQRTLGDVEGGEDFRAMMAEGDVWLTSDEALALGLCDEVVDAVAMVACVRPDLAKMIKAPAALVIAETDEAPAEDDEAAKAAAEAEAKAKEEAEAKAKEEAEAAAAAEAEAKAKEEADAAAAAVQAQHEADIRSACRVFDASDKADGFIAAKADLAEVRKALWKAKAEADEKIETDNTPPAASGGNGDSYSSRADEIRNAYNAALRR